MYCTASSTVVRESLPPLYYLCLQKCCSAGDMNPKGPATEHSPHNFSRCQISEVSTARTLVLPWRYTFNEVWSQNHTIHHHNSVATHSLLLSSLQHFSSTSINGHSANIQAREYFWGPAEFLGTKLTCALIGFVCHPGFSFSLVILLGSSTAMWHGFIISSKYYEPRHIYINVLNKTANRNRQLWNADFQHCGLQVLFCIKHERQCDIQTI